jgi:hypothetical protein
MNKNKAIDVDTNTALTVVNAEKEVAETARLQQAERERMLVQTHQMIGQIRAADAFGKFANVSSLLWLQQVKESKVYKDLPEVGTWESFCNYVGLSRQKVDLDLQNLATFGEEFLLTVSSLSVGYRDLRKLRQLSLDGAVVVEADAVEIGGERIPLDADHKEDLQAAIERVLDEKIEALEDAQATVRAKDRVLESKERVIKNQERELQKLSKEAAGRDMLPEEDAFLQRMENLRTAFDGYMLKADPDAIMTALDGSEVTTRMRASLIATLNYMRMQLNAAHDVAVTNYGDPSMTPEVMAEFMDWTKQQAVGGN